MFVDSDLRVAARGAVGYSGRSGYSPTAGLGGLEAGPEAGLVGGRTRRGAAGMTVSAVYAVSVRQPVAGQGQQGLDVARLQADMQPRGR